jgi:hypothetical protein
MCPDTTYRAPPRSRSFKGDAKALFLVSRHGGLRFRFG